MASSPGLLFLFNAETAGSTALLKSVGRGFDARSVIITFLL